MRRTSDRGCCELHVDLWELADNSDLDFGYALTALNYVSDDERKIIIEFYHFWGSEHLEKRNQGMLKRISVHGDKRHALGH